VCLSLSLYLCVCVYMYVCMCVCVCICIYMRVYICVYVRVCRPGISPGFKSGRQICLCPLITDAVHVGHMRQAHVWVEAHHDITHVGVNLELVQEPTGIVYVCSCVYVCVCFVRACVYGNKNKNGRPTDPPTNPQSTTNNPFKDTPTPINPCP